MSTGSELSKAGDGPSPSDDGHSPSGGLERFATSAAGEQAWNAAALAAVPATPQFRVWHWSRPAIVLGRAQRNRFDRVGATAGADLEVLSRDSGGGAVLAGPWMIGASVVLPPAHPLLGANLIDAYHWLGAAYLEVVERLGVPARLVTPDELRTGVALEPVRWACYGSLSPWEVVDADNRKLVGLAQQRRRDAILLVSGLLVNAPPWPLLCRALDGEADCGRLAAWTSSIELLVGRACERPALERIANALEQRIGAALSGL